MNSPTPSNQKIFGEPPSKHQDLGPILKDVRILLAEDSPDLQMLTALFLTTSGAVVQTASNGAEAAKMALTDSYDLILMDMQMPILDGYGAIKQLQNQGCKTPIVALTAHAMRSDREKYLNLGCVAYISKPVGSDELVEKVAAILRMCKS